MTVSCPHLRRLFADETIDDADSSHIGFGGEVTVQV
jgi:hypothetical protein